MHSDQIHRELMFIMGPDRVIKNADMKDYTSLRTGGKAALLIIPGSKEDLIFSLKTLSASDMDYYIMGNGTNLLVKDVGYNGAIIRIGSDFSKIEVDGERITAQAGALLTQVANKALEYNLSGLEFASGIPGSIGGTVYMNAGAYGGELSQVVESVHVISRDGKNGYTLRVDEMQYGYRKSILMDRGDIVHTVVFKLEKGDHERIASVMKDLSARRTQKQPLNYPSAGSFFKRPESNYAGRLIEESGLKGLRVGGARVSPLHAGFIINEGGATATDIINLMKLVQNIVYDRTGIMLEPEVRIIGD